MRPRVLGGVLALAVAVLAPAGTASAQTADGKASAQALAVRVVLPGGDEEVFTRAAAPPEKAATSSGLEYGEGAVTTGAVWSRAQALDRPDASAAASATVRTVSLFAGEITVGAISTKASAEASPREASAGVTGSWLAQVTILGERVQAGANVRVPLADWGYVVLLEQAVVRESGGRVGRRSFVSGLHVHLTAAHGGLPAGTEIVVGYAEAAASARKETRKEATPPPPPPEPPAAPVAPPAGPKRDPEPQPPGASPKPPRIVRKPPPEVRPRFSGDGYAFPVYGPSTFSDDFGAPRSLTGWHHGTDIFAPVGAPVLAVTDGTLFLVGWNEIGGNRLWLRDDRGNEFYYAHLAAFSPLAFDGSRVKAGDVIGFVGATGDAVGTPSHLHFEIHPAALLALGYDGVVNPYRYLLAWRRLADRSFALAASRPGQAPAPGLVLLQAEDISTASGLDPESLARVLEMPALVGEGLVPGEPSVVASGTGFDAGG